MNLYLLITLGAISYFAIGVFFAGVLVEDNDFFFNVLFTFFWPILIVIIITIHLSLFLFEAPYNLGKRLNMWFHYKIKKDR